MLSNRVQNLKPSPTLALAAKAKSLKAQGHDVISLTVGEPDWDTIEVAKSAGINGIKSGQTKYAPAEGILDLRKAIAKQVHSDIGVEYQPNQVTVTAGAKFILYSALQCLVNPGDEVLIPSPFWVSYPTMVELAGGVPKIVNCGKEENFKLNAKLLEMNLSSKTKAIILNSPSNPTGLVYSAEELKELSQVLIKHPNVFIISDDIYNRLIFTQNNVAPHILQCAPELSDRTLIVNGASKTYSMTGWRLGWALGPVKLISAMTNLQSQSVSCASPFSQLAGLAAIESGDHEVKSILKILLSRRNLAIEQIKKIPFLDVITPDGAFYLWVDFSKICGKAFKGKALTSCSDIAQTILVEEMVAMVPGVEFGSPGFMRFSFALESEKMSKALMRIESFINRLG